MKTLLLASLLLAGTPVPDAKSDAPVKAEVPETATDLKAAGKDAKEQLDFLKARRAFRKVVVLDPADSEVKDLLAEVDAECRRNGKRQISEAKAYMAADNYSEATKSLKLALHYLDQDAYPERKTALELVKTIKRDTER